MNMLYFIQFLRDISIDLCYAHLAKMAPSSSSAYSVRQDLWFLGGDGKVKDKGLALSGRHNFTARVLSNDRRLMAAPPSWISCRGDSETFKGPEVSVFP